MPVEIREIVIRAVATPARPSTEYGLPPEMALDQQELIKACVKEVMRVLEQKKER